MNLLNKDDMLTSSTEFIKVHYAHTWSVEVKIRANTLNDFPIIIKW